MSVLLDYTDVKMVVESLSPSIKDFLSKYAKRVSLAVIVLDPDYTDSPHVLYSGCFGNPLIWEIDYVRIAMGKAEVCLRNKCDSETVRAERPFCYRVGDPPFMGGVYDHGLVVACSGVEGHFDQMFARWIAAGCRAVATHRFLEEVEAKDLDAVPLPPPGGINWPSRQHQ